VICTFLKVWGILWHVDGTETSKSRKACIILKIKNCMYTYTIPAVKLTVFLTQI